MRAVSLLITLLAGLFSPNLLAAPDLVPAPPQLSASASLLVDHHSGRVLVEHNSEARVEPASITKIMTSYVAFQALRDNSIQLDDEVRISKNARYKHTEGSRMFIEYNSLVSVEDLLRGVIVQSGNDASIALAEHIAGSEESFAELMNHYAKALGMDNTHFTNSTGWPDEDHYTTAEDLAKLARAMISDFPEEYAMFAERRFTHNDIQQSNRNRLLWLDGRVDGIKTGFTESADYCLVSSAKDNDMRLISVVMGSPRAEQRDEDSRKLLNYGFRFYETFPLYDADETLTEIRIWKGAQEMVALGLEEPLYITIPRGQRRNVEANMKVDSMIMAPAQKGQEYGTVNLTFGEEQLASKPLVALHDVEEGSLWRKLLDNIKLLFK
ncbi:D-alanyl-D-alanine carboxypeptidase family protein [Thiohalophilus thiocyanatoxydans]|uniref:serine-type D-Ala-D-Ala carboxypeptidase n=1 Tax=Thiohalophilus thiocyanatoxydans TaxID=381308 RepID=A0A4R8J381_9GAMM|nr:D-alanyl-D-alanine carboxypeptidase family protein [Thiohalophilus thiocyanatoxydans]TDY04333.1 penicillin-binding protein 6 [Thiohalophilus thiocyanatoxydans]